MINNKSSILLLTIFICLLAFLPMKNILLLTILALPFVSCDKLPVISSSDITHSELKEDGNSKWMTNYDQAFTKAESENKKVMILFTGSDWCPPCKKANNTIFAEDSFYTNAKKEHILLKLDSKKKQSKESAAYVQKYMAKHNVRGVPSVVIFESDKSEISRTNPLSPQFKAQF